LIAFKADTSTTVKIGADTITISNGVTSATGYFTVLANLPAPPHTAWQRITTILRHPISILGNNTGGTITSHKTTWGRK
jgi:hypothetical protein